MSTKTSFKRIALVAVAGLVTGLVSVAPAQAAGEDSAATLVSSISLASDTSSPKIDTIVNVSFGAVVTGDAADDDDVAKFKAYISSAPAGGFVTATFEDDYAGITDTELGTSDTVTNGALVVTEILNAGDATASATAGNAGINFTPTKTGTYTLVAYHDSDSDGNVDNNEARQSIDIVVAAASAFSTGTSSAYLIDGNGTDVGTAATDAAGASGSKTMSTANVGAITVSLKDAANVAMTSGNTITATISGSGGVGGTTANAPVASQCSATTVVRSVTVSADAVNTIYLCADGTAGTGTVTISVTNAAGVTATLATKTVTFYGSIAKLAVVSTPMSVLRAGGFQSGAITALDGLTATTTPAAVLKATDSGGNVVEGLSITAVSGSTSIIASSTVGEDTVANDADSVYGGPGYYVAHVTSATSAVSGNTTTVTYRIIDPAGDGTTYLTAVATFTVGGSVASETLSFDKTSYIPGEAIVLTRTAKDSAGNPVYDGAASPAVTFNKAVGGTAPAASFYVGGKKATSATTPTLFAPAVSGDFTAQATSSATGTPTITAASTVEGDPASSLALDAANAATDAANNAYDEAQNATQAASDALAAVTALASQVESLIASVKKLTAAVAKLNKKK